MAELRRPLMVIAAGLLVIALMTIVPPWTVWGGPESELRYAPFWDPPTQVRWRGREMQAEGCVLAWERMLLQYVIAATTTAAAAVGLWARALKKASGRS
jgi:hypothetical protein